MTGEELRDIVARAENTGMTDDGGAGRHNAYLLAPLRRFAEAHGSDDLVDTGALDLVISEVGIRLAQECALALMNNPDRRDEALSVLRKLAGPAEQEGQR